MANHAITHTFRGVLYIPTAWVSLCLFTTKAVEGLELRNRQKPDTPLFFCSQQSKNLISPILGIWRTYKLIMNRDAAIDVLKGIGIILVVIGHSGCPQLLNCYIYSFHMPLFFIASGYFFNVNYLENKKKYFERKVKGVYLPYLKWSVIFLFLHNFLYHCGILNPLYGNNDGVCSQLYSIKEILHRLLDIFFRMTSYEDFVLGAYWFMRSLFVGCLVLCFGAWIFNKVVNCQKKSIAIVLLFFCFIGGVMTFFDIHIPYFPQGGYREVMAVFFLGCGYFLKQNDDYLCRSYVILTSLVILIICVTVHPTSMSYKATFDDWLVIPFTGISGFILTYYVSKLIIKYNIISSAFIYVGRNTFYILTFHFLMFKPAALLYSYLYDLDWHVIGSHPVAMQIKDNWFWIIYSVSTLIFSLLLMEILKRLRIE